MANRSVHTTSWVAASLLGGAGGRRLPQHLLLSDLPFSLRFLGDAEGRWQARARSVMKRLPALDGAAIRIEFRPALRDRHGAVHAGAFLRRRRVVFASDVAAAEFGRIFVHELFHFVWLRLGNALRSSYGALLAVEWGAGARGELGWSAEWRKKRLKRRDVEGRTRRWREYCCESFCDTAAYLYSGRRRHGEYSLAPRFRRRRRAWFTRSLESRILSI